MKPRVFLLIAFAACILAACQISTRNSADQSGDSTAIAEGPESTRDGQEPAGKGPAPGRGTDGMPVLMENTTQEQFDGNGGEEVFRVALLGDSVLKGTVAFTITNDEGELIYSDEFPSIMLAATYDESVNTPEKQEQLVKKRINDFFTGKSFKSPAIDAEQPPHDSAFIDKATYDNLRSTNAPGFVYVIGKENGKFIAWSPLEKKVVMYFNCC